MNAGIKIILRTFFYAAFAYFAFLMILITVQYIPINYSAAFLGLKEEAIALKHYKFAFFTHVYTSIFALILGMPQFSEHLRLKLKKLHKVFGYFYIGIILIFASPSGLIMAFYANGGFWSQISFILQAVLWFIFTLLAFQYALKRKFTLHQKFMLRSYALTLSAISLRLFKWGIVSFLQWPPMDTYRLVSWLGWVFNIALVEVYIYFFLSKKEN